MRASETLNRAGARYAQAGQAEILTRGVPSAGRIAGSAIAEREAPGGFGPGGALVLGLENPDFKTAIRIADAVNVFTRFRTRSAREPDPRRVTPQAQLVVE